MRFPPSFIERLRSHFLMSEVIGKRIAIRKHGREYHALCPFHNEKTPSFTINDEKGFFHCFGCGAHGDAIEFIRRYEKLSYPETIERLARDAGIALPSVSPEETRKMEREKTLHDVLDASCAWFEQQLAASSGASARDYLEKRSLKPQTLRQYRIGYAPDDRHALYQHLTKAGFSQSLQAEAGVISVSEQGTVYDRFRGRVIFPIRNARGKIVAFGGRLLAAGQKNLPKYLNSPETPLFKKGEMLFNLDLARQPAREAGMAVVMEGYMDVVSTAQAGIGYAVATLGTAVTPHHLRLLWQTSKEPVLCLDGDAAGKRAMLRAIDICLPLLAPGFSLRFAVLPAGEDPDSFIGKHGKAGFEQVLASSRRLSQIIWETLAPQYRLDLPEGRAALEDACRQITDKITNQTVRQHYLSYFRKQLWDKSAPTARPAQGERSPQIERMAGQHHWAALETLIQRLLHTLTRFPFLLHKSQVEETLSRLDIRSPQLKTVRDALLGALGHTDIDDPQVFAAYLKAQPGGEALDAFLKSKPPLPWRDTLTMNDAMQLWNETVAAYETAHLQVELDALQESMGKSMDEAAYKRMLELQNAIKKARAERTFAPAEPDMA